MARWARVLGGPNAGRVAKSQVSTLHIGKLPGISATKAQKVFFSQAREVEKPDRNLVYCSSKSKENQAKARPIEDPFPTA